MRGQESQGWTLARHVSGVYKAAIGPTQIHQVILKSQRLNVRRVSLSPLMASRRDCFWCISEEHLQCIAALKIPEVVGIEWERIKGSSGVDKTDSFSLASYALE